MRVKRGGNVQHAAGEELPWSLSARSNSVCDGKRTGSKGLASLALTRPNGTLIQNNHVAGDSLQIDQAVALNVARGARAKAKSRLKVGLPSSEEVAASCDPQVWWAGGSLSSVVPVAPDFIGPHMGWLHRSIEKPPGISTGDLHAGLSMYRDEGHFSVSERQRVCKYGPASTPRRSLLGILLAAEGLPQQERMDIDLTGGSVRLQEELPIEQHGDDMRRLSRGDSDQEEAGTPRQMTTATQHGSQGRRQSTRSGSLRDSRLTSTQESIAENEVGSKRSHVSKVDAGESPKASGPKSPRRVSLEQPRSRRASVVRAKTCNVLSSSALQEDPSLSLDDPTSAAFRASVFRRKSSRTTRLKKTCHLKEKALQVRHQQEVRFAALSNEERLSIEDVFQICGRGSELLDLPALQACVFELGFSGRSPAEHLEIERITFEAIANAETLEQGFQSAREECSFHKHTRASVPESLQRSTSVNFYELAQNPATMNIYELALGLLPCLRKSTEEFFLEEFQQRLSSAGAKMTQLVPVSIWARVVWLDGVDPKKFSRLVYAQLRQRGSVRPISAVAKNQAPLELVVRVAASCREQTLHAIRQRERSAQSAGELEEADFKESRLFILDLHDRFCCFGPVKTCKLDKETVRLMMMELGLYPRHSQAQDFDAELAAAFKRNDNELSFCQTLKHVLHHRQWKLIEGGDKLNEYFDTYDKDRSGELSMPEIFDMLQELNLNFQTKEDQDNAKEFFLELVDNGHGMIDRDAFKTIYLRIDEQLRRAVYSQRQASGKRVGLADHDFLQVLQAFDSFDQKDDGFIPLFQAKRAMAQVSYVVTQADVSQDQLEVLLLEHASDPTAIDFDEFMIALEALGKRAKKSADRKGSVSLEEHTPKTLMELRRSHRLKDPVALSLQARTCRQVLRSMHLPKDYVCSLQDNELMGVLGGYVGLDVAANEDLNRWITIKLGFVSMDKFLEYASLFGAQLEKQAISTLAADKHGELQDEAFPPKFCFPASGARRSATSLCHSGTTPLSERMTSTSTL